MVQLDVPKLGDTWEDRKGMHGPNEIPQELWHGFTAPGPQKAQLDRWQVG